MLIPNAAVADWKDLQNKVAELFIELGFKVITPHVVELAGRGKKEVDVFAEDRKASSSTIYIFECKWWNSEVPQDVVHSFHTVVQGCGANTGFIISKQGFQRGAQEAALFSNINLLTFEQVQHKFGDEWYRLRQSEVAHFAKALREASHLHFDQYNTLPISNNVIFHTEALAERLAVLWKWNVGLIIESSSPRPKSYLGPEPVEMAMNPLQALADPPNGEHWHIAPTVRSYFKLLTDGLKSWSDQFEQLRADAQASFAHLSEAEQSNLLARSLARHAEELPIRLLKNKLPPEEFARLLALIS